MHPDRIGPYRIDRKIGSGAMGNVYYGVYEETGTVAAVKVLPASLAREEGFIRRFTREIEALRKVSSRHIVELYDDDSTGDGSFYYAMEYVDGETLTAVISRRKKLPWTEVTDIALQIAAALKSAHDAGVVHRDIKPSNLMISSDGTVKLTDFGVAHLFATTRLTRTGGVVGTAEYMAPEQARGQRATKRSDLYSLGVVMYAMLTGRPPFTGSNANEILHRQQFAQFDRPSHFVPEIPRLFEDLVCQLLEKKPERRIPDALVLSRKLEQVRSRIEFAARQVDESPTLAVAGGRLAVPSESTAAGDMLDPIVEGPGAATLVRDMLREETHAQLRKGRIARFFDNTLVLLTLLGLVIAFGVFMFRRSKPRPEQQLAEAVWILESEPGSAWLRARDSLLAPLLADEVLLDKSAQMRKMIRQVDQYEFCRSLQMTASSDGSAESELQQLIRRSFQLYAEGDVAQARERLAAVASLIAADEEDDFLGGFIQETLSQWRDDVSVIGRRQLLLDILADARQAASDPGVLATSLEKLQSAVTLYEKDTAVAEEVQKCRDLAAELARQQESISASSQP